MLSSLSRYGIGATLLSCALGAAVSAVPLQYNVVVAESDVQVSTTVQAGVDINPDPTELLPGGNDFPTFASMSGTSITQPTTQSKVTADVGLPGSFGNGTNGITFSELSIILPQLPGALEGFGLVPIPLDLTGTNNQFFAFFATVTSFRIDLNSAFSSSLTPGVNPNEWLWAGLADVTISGKLQPHVVVPTVSDTPGPEVPFSQQVTLPLLGTFSGDNTRTRVAVGVDQDALQDQNLNLPPTTQQFDVGDLGLITGLLNLRDFNLVDLSTAVVYQNNAPIPEPNTALLLGLGLVTFGVLRRR
jgi:hypothetical protein